MSPFRKILMLSIGDFLAKAMYFVAFIRMAHVLGVANYGVLEFAVVIRTYLLLLADGGLELWAVREAAKGGDLRQLVARITPLRLLLAILSCVVVAGALAVIPQNPNLRLIMPWFAATVVLQSINLKWVFMGLGKMSRVAGGLVASQLVFSLLVLTTVRHRADLIWAPLAWGAGELVIVAYFWYLFGASYGLRVPFTLRGTRELLRPAMTLGASQWLGVLNYNADSVLLGVLMGPAQVGWYAAAYKPITAALSAPLSYFTGLFPTLSRSYAEGRESFRAILHRSIRLTAIFAMPIGIGGALLAEPVITFLFGKGYDRSIAPLQWLSWSAVLVIMRGNFRHALNAAGRQRIDLLCAAIAVSLNVALNLILIPMYGIRGAAMATVSSEVVWFTIAFYCFSRYVMPVNLVKLLLRPVLGAIAMGAFLYVAEPVFWMLRAALAGVVYLAALILMGEPDVIAKLPFYKPAVDKELSKAVAAK